MRRHLSRLDPGFERRELLVFNKIDLLESFEERSFLEREYPEACFVSAKHGHDLIALKGALARIIDHQNERVRVYLPYRQGALLEQIRRRGNIIRVRYRSNCIELEALVDSSLSKKLAPYSNLPEQETAPEHSAGAEAGDA